MKKKLRHSQYDPDVIVFDALRRPVQPSLNRRQGEIGIRDATDGSGKDEDHYKRGINQQIIDKKDELPGILGVVREELAVE